VVKRNDCSSIRNFDIGALGTEDPWRRERARVHVTLTKWEPQAFYGWPVREKYQSASVHTITTCINLKILSNQVTSSLPYLTFKMLALRSFARSAPRVARISTRAGRPQPSLFRQAAGFQQSWAPVTPRLAASFHMSAARRQEGAGNGASTNWLQLWLTHLQSMKSLSRSSRARSPWKRT
jgi:hypothetical protein